MPDPAQDARRRRARPPRTARRGCSAARPGRSASRRPCSSRSTRSPATSIAVLMAGADCTHCDVGRCRMLQDVVEEPVLRVVEVLRTAAAPRPAAASPAGRPAPADSPGVPQLVEQDRDEERHRVPEDQREHGELERVPPGRARTSGRGRSGCSSSSPTHGGHRRRPVLWKLMMISRTIGYQEKKAKQSTAPIRNPQAAALRRACGSTAARPPPGGGAGRRGRGLRDAGQQRPPSLLLSFRSAASSRARGGRLRSPPAPRSAGGRD